MSERKHGNYHVLHGAFDGWQVAQYCEDGWLITGIQVPMLESDFEEIGPRIPTPDEPWQLVPSEPTPCMMEASGYGASIETVEAWQAMLRRAPKP